MCGFAGFLTSSSICNDDMLGILDRMGHGIKHRGPDEKGHWIDKESGFGFTHRRLSILDLSAAGNQPMESNSKRFIIAYNGEIYNHLDIRKEISFSDWKGHSDTETILECVELLGIKKTLQNLKGMFAFAIWDRLEKKLTLCRDRIGEKPIFFGWQGNTFLFGSELKSFFQHPSFQKKMNRDILSNYFKFGYCQTNYSIFKGIRKIEPGTYVEISKENKVSRTFPYWDLNNCFDNVGNNLGYSDAKRVLDHKLNEAVVAQTLSDVPIGSFLSGGVDSSLVTAILQENSMEKIKTFSIGFDDAEFNEAQYAKKIANYLSTDHHELYVSNDDYLKIIPQLPSIYDEPFADSSAIPTYLVSKFASENVKVVLSGDAGDELFFGYNHYARFLRNWSIISRIPNAIKNYSISFSKIFNRNEFLKKMKGHFMHDDIINYYSFILDMSKNYDMIKKYDYDKEFLNQMRYIIKNNNIYNSLMYYDIKIFLQDDILVKVDRAAMKNSLETRIPFLYPDFLNYAIKLNTEYKYKNGIRKYIVKDLLSDYLPLKLFDRKKQGFSVPLKNIITGPLREWSNNLINKFEIELDSHINPKNIKNLWELQTSNNGDNFRLLWNVVMYQSWEDKMFNN
ncbi:MAG: asparagine synthase (glutamine-hydrolyzing) [Candidatus Marinimicrobia bacterium]|nr:asparagine synthase (glutamine-hydrolyzing) [Candidatus Neomarinimicrobiota bacterium]|tara:strand:- start:3552 stop:5417 length:1866 start_codon:yes stop_codon:yes gene_type:complete